MSMTLEEAEFLLKIASIPSDKREIVILRTILSLDEEEKRVVEDCFRRLFSIMDQINSPNNAQSQDMVGGSYFPN
jgi:hypothetical protein